MYILFEQDRDLTSTWRLAYEPCYRDVNQQAVLDDIAERAEMHDLRLGRTSFGGGGPLIEIVSLKPIRTPLGQTIFVW